MKTIAFFAAAAAFAVTADIAFGAAETIYENANSCLRFGYEGFSVGAAHPIGTTFRNGALRMVLDMRLPGSFGTDTDVLERMAVSLGDDTLYSGVRAACLAGRFLSVGVGFSGATSSGVPRYLDGTGAAHTGAYSLEMSSWYRAEITVHLDADPKTFDYVDTHWYVDHPDYPQGGWGLPSVCRNADPAASVERLAPNGVSFARAAGKPFTVTECDR